MPDLVAVKVGGSLYDLADLGPRLCRWLDTDERVRPPAQLVFVPGGGPAVDVIRNLDRRHSLGEERSHWLALATLTLNAHFLAALLPSAEVVQEVRPDGSRLRIVDPFAYLREDERRRGTVAVPHVWTATSDAVAALIAVRTGARRLVLCKSVTVPAGQMDWEEAGRRGLVDPHFASILPIGSPGLEVSVVNLRHWPDGEW